MGFLLAQFRQRFVSGNFKFVHIYSFGWVILGRVFISPQLLESNS